MSRFTTDELWDMYIRCDAWSENPRYKNLARRIKAAIEGGYSPRFNRLEKDLLEYAMFPEASDPYCDKFDEKEHARFVKKLYG